MRCFSILCGVAIGTCFWGLRDVGAEPAAALPAPLLREPSYREAPRYALLLLGAEQPAKVWIVQDGKSLYIDQNANGDLTDDGPPVTATDERKPAGSTWDRNYRLDRLSLPSGRTHRAFDLRNWNYGDPEDQYGLSLSLDGQVPMYAGWNALLAKSASEAPVIHFGRSVAPRILRNKTLTIGVQPSRFSITFTNPDYSRYHDARLSIDALPAGEHPTVRIEWPTAEGAAPVVSEHLLNERCCYWEFYTTNFSLPPGVAPGTARASVTVPLSFPLELQTNRFEFPVTARP